MRLSIALVYILEFEKWCFTGSPDKAHRKSSSKSNITAFFAQGRVISPPTNLSFARKFEKQIV